MKHEVASEVCSIRMKQGVAQVARAQFPAHRAGINDPLNVRMFYVTLFSPGKIEESIKITRCKIQFCYTI